MTLATRAHLATVAVVLNAVISGGYPFRTELVN